jgi:hypothetical protein
MRNRSRQLLVLLMLLLQETRSGRRKRKEEEEEEEEEDRQKLGNQEVLGKQIMGTKTQMASEEKGERLRYFRAWLGFFLILFLF